RVRTCALVWLEDSEVRLVSHSLRRNFAGVDPMACLHQFPEATEQFEAFQISMTCLETASSAVASTEDMQRICHQHPEWRLCCVDYDASDAHLRELAELFEFVELARAMPESLMQDYLG